MPTAFPIFHPTSSLYRAFFRQAENAPAVTAPAPRIFTFDNPPFDNLTFDNPAFDNPAFDNPGPRSSRSFGLPDDL